MALDNERNELPIGAEQDQPFEEIVVPVETPHKQELWSKRKAEIVSEPDTKKAELENQIIQNSKHSLNKLILRFDDQRTGEEEAQGTLATKSSSDLIIKEHEDEVDETILLLEEKIVRNQFLQVL